LSDLPAADPGIRTRLERELNEKGLSALHGRLGTIDPRAARRIHPNDPQRTLRALEVWEVTGRPLSELQGEAGQKMPYRSVKLVRSPDSRAELHRRINARFVRMLDDGFVEEVEHLVARGDLKPDMPSMRSVGYRQVWAWLRGECSRAEMVERGQAATRQLAKRQMTWLRSERDCHWLVEAGNVESQALRLVESVRTV
jgi:tRNA dimethylallyltransferase